MKKWIILVIIIGGLGWATVNRIEIIKSQKPAKSIDEIQKETGIPVSIFETSKNDYEQTVSVSGTIKGMVEVLITPTITERIKTIHVTTGQTVSKGDILVTLDARTSKLNLKQVQKSLKMNQAQLAEANTNYKLQIIETKRQEKLYKQEATTLQRLQQARAKRDSSLATLNAAKAQKEVAKVAVEQAQKNLDDHILKAPCNGSVARNILEEGDVVEMNKPIFKLADLSKVYLDLNISELYLPKITKGMTVKVTLDSLPGTTFTGTIDQINPVANTTDRSYLTRILIDNKDNLIRSGMFARATIVTHTIKQAVAIPLDAIRNDGKKDFALLIGDSDKVVRKDITIGKAFGKLQEITEGLQSGEKIITLSQNIQPGDLVKYEQLKEPEQKTETPE